MKALISASALLLYVSYASASHDYLFDGNADTTVVIHNTNDQVGLWSTGRQGVIGLGRQFGVYGRAEDSDPEDPSLKTGVLAEAQGNEVSGSISIGVDAHGVASETAYGIMAEAHYCTNCYAGYFNGNVTVTGTFSNPSDRKFKKDVKPLDAGLKEILALGPKSYRMDTEAFSDFRFSEGKQFGLIAQELETVLPNLVSKNIHITPATAEERKKGVKKAPVHYKSVEYLGLIPVLIRAVQEQQTQIQSQQNVIATLQAEVASLKGR